MTAPTGTGISRWKAVIQAITAFVTNPKSLSLNVGIQYFPLAPDCGNADNCDPFSCNAGDYAVPEIGIAGLDVNAGKISASLAAHKPLVGTPTYPALQGALTYAKTWAAAHPTHTVVVVLATDGIPDGCAIQDIPSIAALATTATQGTPPVLTYVIGVGSSLKDLNAIAAGGGTKSAFLVDGGGDVVQQFGAALQAIQGKALGCSYAIPMPADGKTVDYNKVNVQMTLAGGVVHVLNYVADESKCDPQLGGWHFDDATAPTKILLCATTCATVSADSAAKVDILLGCARSEKPQ